MHALLVAFLWLAALRAPCWPRGTAPAVSFRPCVTSDTTDAVRGAVWFPGLALPCTMPASRAFLFVEQGAFLFVCVRGTPAPASTAAVHPWRLTTCSVFRLTAPKVPSHTPPQ